MNPTTSIDAEIARRVFGWVDHGPYLVPPELHSFVDGTGAVQERLLDAHQIPETPAVSTDFRDGFALVEAMRRAGWWFQIDAVSIPPESEKERGRDRVRLRASVMMDQRSDPDGTYVYGHGTTILGAICDGVLKAAEKSPHLFPLPKE